MRVCRRLGGSALGVLWWCSLCPCATRLWECSCQQQSSGGPCLGLSAWPHPGGVCSELWLKQFGRVYGKGSVALGLVVSVITPSPGVDQFFCPVRARPGLFCSALKPKTQVGGLLKAMWMVFLKITPASPTL